MAEMQDGQLAEELLLRKRIAENAARTGDGTDGEDNTPATLHTGSRPAPQSYGQANASSQDRAGPAMADGTGPTAALPGSADAASMGTAARSDTVFDPMSQSQDPQAYEAPVGENGASAAPVSPSVFIPTPTAATSIDFGAPAGSAGSTAVPGRPSGDSEDGSGDAPPVVDLEDPAQILTEEPVDTGPAIAVEGVDENEAGARAAVIDRNGAEDLTFSLEDDRFEIVDDEIRLRADVSLDHEAGDTVSVDVTSTDAAGEVRTFAVEIPVNDVNEAPTSLTFSPAQTAATESAMLTVRLGGEAWRGNPRYEIMVDGQKVAQGEVTWSHSGGKVDHDSTVWRDVDVEVPRGPNGIGRVEVRFPNDAYGGDSTRDRNLLVDRIVLDGQVMEAEGSNVEYKGGRGPRERMSWGGKLVFDTTGIEPSVLPTIAENEAGAVVGRIDVADPDASETFTYTVSDDTVRGGGRKPEAARRRFARP